ncbi:MAG: pyridoxal-phosphate dependent enzyme [Thermoproteota archaeon]
MRTYPTPLVRLDTISEQAGTDVYGKLEYANPTGSHKDRESLKVLDDAVSKGFKDVAITSTGNAAVSLAAYSLVHNVRCHVFVPDSVSEEKARLISSFGGRLHMVKGRLKRVFEECVNFIELSGAYDANPGRNEKKIEGDSAIGIEIAAQLDVMPSYVSVPTNNGTLLAGVWSGFRKTDARPKMIAATAPVTEIADSIAGYSRLDEVALEAALKESGGMVVSVSDEDIVEATLSLMREGIFCEPASATSLAALKLLSKRSGEIEGPAVLLITGTILKYPARIKSILDHSLSKKD